MTSQDFMRAATQRLETAIFLFESKYTLDATYLGGYCVECSLKALILYRCTPSRQSHVLQQITSGARMHQAEVLLDLLKGLCITLSVELAKRMRRFKWTTELRYETGRLATGETRAFLKTVQLIHTWVEEQLT